MKLKENLASRQVQFAKALSSKRRMRVMIAIVTLAGPSVKPVKLCDIIAKGLPPKSTEKELQRLLDAQLIKVWGDGYLPTSYGYVLAAAILAATLDAGDSTHGSVAWKQMKKSFGVPCQCD